MGRGVKGASKRQARHTPKGTRKHNDNRGESGRRVSNPRPRAWEARAEAQLQSLYNAPCLQIITFEMDTERPCWTRWVRFCSYRCSYLEHLSLGPAAPPRARTVLTTKPQPVRLADLNASVSVNHDELAAAFENVSLTQPKAKRRSKRRCCTRPPRQRDSKLRPSGYEPEPETRWTTWGTVSSGFREIEIG
jgi:hypothetical protein